ncbi:hypothetical protein TraAM80_07318 [Trypanosoma rangeli]|uniref:Uncharacterized protein n=1 Tax=Trypanosoma rangeli TaxID=5698 RepID=A0A422N618_TRYRA|nr:uncharacterized protein TraAM80_07318 [Trypanosoma rangeli]RNF00927.1 hypothetical protein TraAM80_07318 [Trypanosoma rangeli]|eukprot:RNF00927.1 hypothetical protein TraAM80_07318 [Trypanosoma rangeli]
MIFSYEFLANAVRHVILLNFDATEAVAKGKCGKVTLPQLINPPRTEAGWGRSQLLLFCHYLMIGEKSEESSSSLLPLGYCVNNIHIAMQAMLRRITCFSFSPLHIFLLGEP